MIEYTLLLIISVGLVLMVMYKIFQPLQGFVKSYMGDYVACLLETGELPAMGGDSTVAQDEGCNSNFEAGTLKEGRPYKGAGPSNPPNSSDKSQNASHSSGGGGGGGGGSSGGHLFGEKGTRVADVQAPNGKVTEMAVSGGTSNGFFNAGRGGGAYQRPPKESSVFLSGLTDEERKKLDKKKEGGSRTIAAAEGMGTPPKKTQIKPPEPKTVEMEDSEPMTFGNFLRILFIAAVIIAIVIFIGGQVLQMSKNSE